MPAPVSALLLLACGSVRREYEIARDLALADPGPAPADWSPDAAVLLSAPVVEDIVSTAARSAGPLATKLDAGFVALEPELTVTRLALAEGECARCLAIDVELDGTLRWDTPLLSGTSPVAVAGRLDTELAVEPLDDLWTIRVAPRDLHDVSVEVAGYKAGVADVRGTLVDWVESALVYALPPLTLAELGGDDLPLRGVRVIPIGKAVRIDLLTAAPLTGTVPTDASVPDDGFRVDLSVASLLAVARAEAFRQDPVAHGVVPEPTALEIGPDGFVLGLRLWHPTGGAWWRDYVVHGEARLREGKLELVPTHVEEGEHSRGAALADPLVALVEGALLKAIDNAVDTTLPAAHSERIQGVRTRVTLTGIDAYEGVLRASGTVALRQPRKKQ